MPPRHIMFDIETMGMAPNGAIIQIGASVFDLDVGNVYTPRVHNIYLQSSVDRGMQIDPSTIEWWLMDEQREAYRSTLKDRISLFHSLTSIAVQWDWADVHGVWSNAPLFDFAILRRAFELCHIPCPWSYRMERCSRTLLTLAGLKKDADTTPPERHGLKHNAGDDAFYQAQYTVRLFKQLMS